MLVLYCINSLLWGFQSVVWLVFPCKNNPAILITEMSSVTISVAHAKDNFWGEGKIMPLI